MTITDLKKFNEEQLEMRRDMLEDLTERQNEMSYNDPEWYDLQSQIQMTWGMIETLKIELSFIEDLEK